MVGMDNIRFNVYETITKAVGIEAPGRNDMDV
jgi:hypothetical protein